MDLEEIAPLCASMSIVDVEAPVVKVEGKLKQVGDYKLGLCLVGRVITNKQVNREAFRGIILKIWRTTQDFDVEVLKENTFIFQFRNHLDHKRVLAGGPWSLDCGLLVLEEPVGAGHINGMKFDKAEFWVQVHNIPIVCMDREFGSFIGKQIGVLREIDLGATGDCLGKYLRVRVRIDITKPLRHGLRLDLGEDEASFLLVRYEKLHDHCFHCGKIGHLFRECLGDSHIHGETKQDYGAWLRASSPQKSRLVRMEQAPVTATAVEQPLPRESSSVSSPNLGEREMETEIERNTKSVQQE
ncbi:hypothetical protein ACOSQ3_031254 [Xanthoceras sorbifolium]